jgi:6-pyruvoyltetrahydropterin/6-carboxytetrahydropterin synthase
MRSAVLISKQYKFEASHILPFQGGKCARHHGHSYVMEVAVTGPVKGIDPNDRESGMVVDFQRIDDIVKPLVNDVLDHHHLNDEIEYPTAENIALWMIYQIDQNDPPYELAYVKVWETANCWALATPDDLNHDQL